MSILNFICNTNAYKNLPEDQKSIFCKYMTVLPALEANEENCKAVLSFAEENNINFNTIKALIRFTCEDLNDIKIRIAAYKEAGYERIILNNPELIRFDAKEVLYRIEQCIKAGKGIEIDGRFAEFLFDDLQWKTVKENLCNEDVTVNELANKGKSAESEILRDAARKPDEQGLTALEKILFVNDAYDLDADQFERYIQLTELLKNVRHTIYTVDVGDNTEARISSDMVISKLIGYSTESNLSNNDIIKACLYYCNGETNLTGVDSIIEELELNQENKRGL
ncbi:MAG: hypothetical protein IJO33_01650 [Bacilli bacterium]|nr:hypothetical protein [Bacilli bacterium]